MGWQYWPWNLPRGCNRTRLIFQPWRIWPIYIYTDQDPCWEQRGPGDGPRLLIQTHCFIHVCTWWKYQMALLINYLITLFMRICLCIATIMDSCIIYLMRSQSINQLDMHWREITPSYSQCQCNTTKGWELCWHRENEETLWDPPKETNYSLYFEVAEYTVVN